MARVTLTRQLRKLSVGVVAPFRRRLAASNVPFSPGARVFFVPSTDDISSSHQLT